MRPTAARESPRRCRARAPPSRRHAGVGSTSRCPPVLSLPRHDGRSDDGRPDDGRSDDGRPDDGRTALDRTRRRAHGPTAARAAPRRPGLHHDRSSNPADLAVGCVTSRPIGPRRTTDAQRPADPPTRRPADPPTRRPADPPTRRPADPPKTANRRRIAPSQREPTRVRRVRPLSARESPRSALVRTIRWPAVVSGTRRSPLDAIGNGNERARVGFAEGERVSAGSRVTRCCADGRPRQGWPDRPPRRP